MKNIFKDLKMKWLSVILFAVIAGVYTGFVMLIPFLKNTSFQDIGISYEWWVVFAVIIVANCNKSYEAMLKCFVFFLISQPLVYIVEILFGSLTLSLAETYYFKIWLPMTILTLPGGFIAYFCKKQNLLGAIILGLGNTIQCVLGVAYAIMAITSFPNHLLSSLFSFASIFVMSFAIQDKRKYRIISIALAFVLTTVLIVVAKMMGLYIVSGVF